MSDAPTGVKLTSYSGEAADMSQDQLDEYRKLVHERFAQRTETAHDDIRVGRFRDG